jgi:hypothetical protein
MTSPMLADLDRAELPPPAVGRSRRQRRARARSQRPAAISLDAEQAWDDVSASRQGAPARARPAELGLGGIEVAGPGQCPARCSRAGGRRSSLTASASPRS